MGEHMGEKKVKGANSFFIAFLRNTVGRALQAHFNIKYEGTSLEGLRPPFIVLGNHTNNLDPIFMAAGIKYPIHFVASDEYFRSPMLRFLLNRVGAIPKVKLTADINSVNNIRNLIEAKRAIGIFPEGSRSWDGNTLNVLIPTAKLIKRLKVPVVAAEFTGAYYSWPRWAKSIRRGQIKISYKIILNENDIEEKSSVEIYSIINNAMKHNEYESQNKLMQPFKGKALAEHLELFLYICPECLNIGSLNSENDRLCCKKCGYEVKYDKYGFFKSDSKLHFDNPAAWGQWQRNWFSDKIKEHFISMKVQSSTLSHSSLTDILLEDEVFVKTGEKASPLKDFGEGNINLNLNELKFLSTYQKELTFDIKKIRGINVQYNSLFEFYYENVLYRFIFKTKFVSAYKWVEAMEIIKELQKHQ